MSLRGWRGGWIAAVADGMGSRPHSAMGARAAVQGAQAVLRQGGAASQWRNTDAREVATQIYRRWLQTIPWVDKSIAATTLLLAACDHQGNARVWQLGDGMIACRTKGLLQVITPERDGFTNETRALGTHRAWSDWSVADLSLKDAGDSLVLMTDGISEDIRPEAIEPFVRVLHSSLSSMSRRRGRAWLQRELENWATPNHSDDKSIAVIYRK